jgi:AcrR family transcriptional regulator
MAPSALYRYFPGRDALLSALILGAYESLADDAEAACAAALGNGGSEGARWPAVPRAMRSWSLTHPHEWSLIFGTPVPGYRAPEDTVVPYARLATALVRPVVDARAAGRLGSSTGHPPASDALRDAVAPVAEALLPGAPASLVVLVLQAWSTLIGVISLELFGHWNNTILEPELFFEATMAHLASTVGLV